MGGKAEYREFRILLRNAIGPDRTQAEFAQEAGISVEHVNRMLNSDIISQPTVSTLSKIAGHAHSGVTLGQLKAACGHDDKKTPDDNREISKRKGMEMHDRTNACIGDIQDGVKALLDRRTAYSSLYDFLNTVLMLYAVEDLSFDIESVAEVNDERHSYATDVAVITMSFTDTDFSAEFAFALYYAKTVKGDIFILDAAFDFATLYDMNFRLANEIARVSDLDFDTLKKNQSVCFVYSKKPEKQASNIDLRRSIAERVSEIQLAKGIGAKEAFFQALFGDPDRPQRVSTVEGIGFYIDYTPEYVFRKFLQKHKETFCQSDTENAVFADVVAGEKPLADIFEWYEPDSKFNTCGHWGIAIVNIIYRETGLNLELWVDEDQDKYGFENRAVIMLPERAPWHLNEAEKELSLASATQILDRYAVDLRTEVQSDVYFTMKLDL